MSWLAAPGLSSVLQVPLHVPQELNVPQGRSCSRTSRLWRGEGKLSPVPFGWAGAAPSLFPDAQQPERLLGTQAPSDKQLPTRLLAADEVPQTGDLPGPDRRSSGQPPVPRAKQRPAADDG